MRLDVQKENQNMRRKDREITDKVKIVNIMKKCDCCNLALNGEEFPYVIPLSFGFCQENDELKLYFHSAKEGTKIDFIKRNEKAAFTMHTTHQLELGEKACDSTMRYESVCGNGTIRFIEGQEKIKALKCIMNQYEQGKEHVFSEKVLPLTEVMELTVEHISGKESKA